MHPTILFSLLPSLGCLSESELDHHIADPLELLDDPTTDERTDSRPGGGDTHTTPGDDDGTGPGTPDDGGGETKGSDTVVPLQSNNMAITFDGRFEDGHVSDWHDPATGDLLVPEVWVVLFDDSWDWDWDDTDRYCAYAFEPQMDASLRSTYRNLGAWDGWRLDLQSAYLGEGGNCAGLDPATWSSDPVAELDSWGWSYGLGLPSGALNKDLSTLEGWQQFDQSAVAVLVGFEDAGLEPTECSYALAYDTGPSGHLIYVDVAGQTEVPDAYYDGQFFYQLSLD